MATDFDGNTLAVGDKVWIPGTVASIGAAGMIGVTTAYNAQALNVPANTSRKPRTFPDAP